MKLLITDFSRTGNSRSRAGKKFEQVAGKPAKLKEAISGLSNAMYHFSTFSATTSRVQKNHSGLVEKLKQICSQLKTATKRKYTPPPIRITISVISTDSGLRTPGDGGRTLRTQP